MSRRKLIPRMHVISVFADNTEFDELLSVYDALQRYTTIVYMYCNNANSDLKFCALTDVSGTVLCRAEFLAKSNLL